MSFDSFGLSPALLKGVRDMEFSRPTPIQAAAIPPAMEGRDLIASAMTGSGKTAAFLLPLLHRLSRSGGDGTRALVLSPTRELAAQIEEHLRALSAHTRLRAAVIFGGVGANPQERALRSGVDVVVATPGRLLDHLGNGVADFSGLEVLVLDEADRMLDMGFLPDIRRVLKHLPTERQTLFFSATMPSEIVKLAREMLRDPVRVEMERKTKPATGITQAAYPVPEAIKAEFFVEMLRRDEVGSAIVFCRTKHRTNRLAQVLDRHGVSNARIHGNRSQSARTDALEGFREGRYRVLVATDIVARGIDVEELEHVVNFDVPGQAEDYVHRVGRTARAEATGEAYTLVSPEEERDFAAIERAVGARIPRRKLDGFDYSARPDEPFEVPRGQRIAEIRRRRAEDRERARVKAERKAQRQAEEEARRGGRGSASNGNGSRNGDGEGGGGASRKRRRGRRRRSPQTT